MVLTSVVYTIYIHRKNDVHLCRFAGLALRQYPSIPTVYLCLVVWVRIVSVMVGLYYQGRDID
jgi:hypothetical protein